MSEVLYRKWRPQRLDEVVGQEPITQTLRNAVLQERVAHAYLFCGPRGTGKTSTARILAKAINCLSPQDGEPDNACHICVSINEGRALDLIEIDAASNRGIDDIRNLSDKIHYTPNESRYKVYIVDEVHMLTEHAFNALLKTLEEPPGHAIFVLATTEAHKVPLTIISRCQRFDFRRIPVDRIVDKLRELCAAEDFEVDDDALRVVARHATGSLRDAENLLEQLVVSYGSSTTVENVNDLLGLGGEEMALEFVESIANSDSERGLKQISDIMGQGNDLRQLLQGTMEYLRAVLLIKSNAGSSLGYQTEVTVKLQSLADSISLTHLVNVLKIFSKVDMRRDGSSSLPLELALVESSTDLVPVTVAVAAPPPAPVAPNRPANEQRVPPRPAPTRSQGTSGYNVYTPPASPVPDNQPDPPPVVIPSGPAGTLETGWGEFVRAMRHTGKRFKLGALLRGCKEREVSGDLITLKFPYLSHVERMEQELGDPATRREVKEVLANVMGRPYEVEISLIESAGNGVRTSAAQRSHLVRTAMQMGARVVDEKEEGQ